MKLSQNWSNQLLKKREELHQLGDLYPKQVINASYDFDQERLHEQGELTHLIGFISSKENVFDDLEQVAVPECTWAIFPNQGPFPETLQRTWGNIYAEWLPSSGYELINAQRFLLLVMMILLVTCIVRFGLQ